MGRKRKEKVKVHLRLSVDPNVLDALVKDGVNKSELFTIAA